MVPMSRAHPPLLGFSIKKPTPRLPPGASDCPFPSPSRKNKIFPKCPPKRGLANNVADSFAKPTALVWFAGTTSDGTAGTELSSART